MIDFPVVHFWLYFLLEQSLGVFFFICTLLQMNFSTRRTFAAGSFCCYVGHIYPLEALITGLVVYRHDLLGTYTSPGLWALCCFLGIIGQMFLHFHCFHCSFRSFFSLLIDVWAYLDASLLCISDGSYGYI